MAVELAVCVSCFVFPGRAGNLLGYLMGTLTLAITAILFRNETLRRAQGNDAIFVNRPRVRRAVGALLAAGFVVAAAHAYFVAQTRTFA
jgi:hypothetical protein